MHSSNSLLQKLESLVFGSISRKTRSYPMLESFIQGYSTWLVLSRIFKWFRRRSSRFLHAWETAFELCSVWRHHFSSPDLIPTGSFVISELQKACFSLERIDFKAVQKWSPLLPTGWPVHRFTDCWHKQASGWWILWHTIHQKVVLSKKPH